MMLRLFSIVVLGLSIVSCNHSNGSNDSTPLSGKWITEACEQPEIINSMGDPVSFWGKGVYEFLDDGRIAYSVRIYNDSSCTGEYNEIQATAVDGDFFMYKDLGNEILQEGISGRRVEITLPIPTIRSAEGFCTTIQGALCFSDNLNFNAFSWSTSDAEYTSIDFESCLRRDW